MIDLSEFKKNGTKAKRLLTWPLYGLHGLENTQKITNDEEKKFFIPNFNQIRLVVSKSWTKQEIAHVKTCFNTLQRYQTLGCSLKVHKYLGGKLFKYIKELLFDGCKWDIWVKGT